MRDVRGGADCDLRHAHVPDTEGRAPLLLKNRDPPDTRVDLMSLCWPIAYNGSILIWHPRARYGRYSVGSHVSRGPDTVGYKGT